jgi:hypothetical protein
MDSILTMARDKIQASVLMSDNNTLAIHAELPKLNQMLMSNLAAALGDAQRTRFREFLDRCNAPYTITDRNPAHAGIPSALFYAELRRPPKTDRFFVITPDSAAFSEIRINADSLRVMMADAAHRLESARERAHIVIREFAVRSRHRDNPEFPLTVSGDGDNISIRVTGAQTESSPDDILYRLVPRIPRSAEREPVLPFIPNNGLNRSRMAIERQPESARSMQHDSLYQPLQRKSVSLDSLLHAVPNRSSGRDDQMRGRKYDSPIEL